MGHGNKVEFLVAICALLSSIIAIFVAWDQGRVMRAQQHGMVYPVLQVDGFVSTQEHTISMGLRLENSGVGPALVESVEAVVDGEVIETLDAYRDALPSGYDISWAGLAGRAIAPGNQVEAIRIEWPRDSITADQLNAAVSTWAKIEFNICYCSVFENCWTTSMGISRAQQVKACALSDRDVFEQIGMTGVRPSPALPSEDQQ